MFSNRTITLMSVVAALAFLALGAWLRVPGLEQRILHGDEAINIAKMAPLYERGEYEYDPRQFHGPSLYYAALPAMWLTGADDWRDVPVWVYRAVPVVFGLLLVVGVWLLHDGLGKSAGAVAMLLTALSPAMVFYSRYFVHEMMLVVFTLGVIGFGWRYLQRPRVAWAIAAGACLGLMHATKETCIIAWFAMAVAAAIVWLWHGGAKGRLADGQAPSSAQRFAKVKVGHLMAGLVAAVAVSVTLFTSFFTHWRGPLDSVLCYAVYLGRAGESIHVQPWYYYFQTFLWTKKAPGPVWSEAFIAGLALVGLVFALIGPRSTLPQKRFTRFLALYAILITAVYTAIPYKTPWSALSMWHAWILLAGLGAWSVLRFVPTHPGKVVMAIALIAGAIHLGMQAQRTVSRRFEGDFRNPWVYAHPTQDLLRWTDEIERMADVHPQGRRMLIVTVLDNAWPVPWYLRQFDNVAYWDHPPTAEQWAEATQGRRPAIVIVERGMEDRVEPLLSRDIEYAGPRIKGLRHGVPVYMYVRKALWDEYVAARK